LYVIGLVGDDSDESGDTETHRYTHMDETRHEERCRPPGCRHSGTLVITG
jgi:hypothetical protein